MVFILLDTPLRIDITSYIFDAESIVIQRNVFKVTPQ